MAETTGAAILYAAKSTEDKHGSIPTQLEDGRAFAEREGLEVVAEYADEAASAYKGDRGPELARAIGHAQRLGASLIVQHSDRLARGDGKQARHLAELFFFAARVGIRLRSVQDDSSFDNPILAVVMGERNMEDSRRKGAAVKAGLERRRKRGMFTGNTPFGYLLRRNQDDQRVLVVNEEQAPWVRFIFARYLAGGSYAGIARELEAKGVPSPKGGSLWSHFSLRKILMSPVYAGLIRNGEELIAAVHEAIIDRDTWEKAEALRKAKARTHKRGRPTVGKHLFRKGFLKCGVCGEDMSPLTHRGRPAPTDEIYRCLGRKRHSHTCEMSAIYRADVDEAIYAYFEGLDLDVEATRKQMASATERKLAEARELLKQAQHEEQESEARLKRVKRDYFNGDLTAAEWRELREELEQDLKAAKAEAQSLEARLQEAEDGTALAEVQGEVLQRLSEVREAVAREIKDAEGAAAVRAVLMRLFEGFMLHRGGPAQEHLGLTKGESWIEPLVIEHVVEGYAEGLRPAFSHSPSGAQENCVLPISLCLAMRR